MSLFGGGGFGQQSNQQQNTGFGGFGSNNNTGSGRSPLQAVPILVTSAPVLPHSIRPSLITGSNSAFLFI